MSETRPPDLRQQPFFSSMPDALLGSLQVCLLKWELAPGAIIVRRGERSGFMGILSQGRIELEKESGDVQTIESREVFGEAMLRYGVPSAYTVKVIEPTTLWILWRSDWLAAKHDYDVAQKTVKISSPTKDRTKLGASKSRKPRRFRLGYVLLPLILVLIFYFLGPTLFALTNRHMIDLAMQMQRPEWAVQYLRFVLDWRENTPELHDALGYLLFNQGDLYGALGQFQQAVQQDENLAVARNNLGVVLLDQGQSDEAIIHLLAAVELDPGNAVAYKNLGDAYLIAGKLEESSFAYQRAFDLDPQQLEARAHWAGIALDQGQIDQARLAWEQVVAANPRIAFAQRGLGVIAVLQERPVDALLYLEAARLVDPSDAVTHVYLGVTLEALNRPEDAIDEYTQALSLSRDPDLAAWVWARINELNRQSSLSDGSKKGGVISIPH
jgi:tetratricopeptide (TPR) repeat protein